MPDLAQEQTEALLAVADKWIGKLATSFAQAIQEIQNNLYDASSVEIALSRNDIEGALLATGVDKLEDLLYGAGLGKDSYVFAAEIYAAFRAGVDVSVKMLSDEAQKIFYYDALNDRAVANLKLYGANTVKDISVSTRQGLRTALIEHVKTYANPEKAAGEVRQLLGLTDSQMKAVLNFRNQLEQKKLFGLTDPTKRRLNAIDRSMIGRHMREGNFSQANIDAMVEKYYKSLLNKRAKDIARTESQNAVHNGQLEMWIQGIEQGLFDDTDRKFWIVTPDDRLRPTHAAIPMMNPFGVPITHSFITPFGPVMSPGDSNVNLINCRCGCVLGKKGSTYNAKGGMQYA